MNATYLLCVAQARLPVFYADLGVPDTVEGRFDLLILHVILVILRLKAYPLETQKLFDLLFADMDRNLREMGVSDMRLAKKMKPLFAAFYGRAKVYEEAIPAPATLALEEALARNLYASSSLEAKTIECMADYVRRASENLALQNPQNIKDGQLLFPKVRE